MSATESEKENERKLCVVLFDTETNGLPKRKNAPVTEVDVYPAILSLSWALYEVTIVDKENTFTMLDEHTRFLRLSPKVPWDASAAAIHGITEEQARFGSDRVSASSAIKEFTDVLQSADIVVAHNMAFDKPVVQAAAYACGLPLKYTYWSHHLRVICTMEFTRDLVKIPFHQYQQILSSPPRSPHKPPKLKELYFWLFNHNFEHQFKIRLHSSETDVKCLSLCFIALVERGYLVL